MYLTTLDFPCPLQKVLTKKLSVKFKNVRKRSLSPSVREYSDERAKKRERSREVRVEKLPDYNPPVVNTTTTDEGLINKLKFDNTADVHGTCMLMISTFPRRRQEILGTRGRSGMSMSALKRRYPTLFTLNQVRKTGHVGVW